MVSIVEGLAKAVEGWGDKRIKVSINLDDDFNCYFEGEDVKVYVTVDFIGDRARVHVDSHIVQLFKGAGGGSATKFFAMGDPKTDLVGIIRDVFELFKKQDYIGINGSLSFRERMDLFHEWIDKDTDGEVCDEDHMRSES